MPTHRVKEDGMTEKYTQNDLDRMLQESYDKAMVRQRAQRSEQTHATDSMLQEQEQNRAFMRAQCRPASPGEYMAWLKGYVLAGGEPTHFYDYPLREMWMALGHLEVRPLYGAFSMRILVPDGVCEDGGPTGHTDLFIISNGHYYTRGFHDRPSSVPMWSNTR
jgi:hypothetical protein